MNFLSALGAGARFSSDVALEQLPKPPASPFVPGNADSSAPPGAVRTLALTAVLLGLLTLTFCLLGIGNPPQPYYDEHYYVSAAQAFLAHAPNPNAGDPPLGKLLIALGITAVGDNALGWRIPSAVCGALTLVAVFLWTYLLLADFQLALLAAALALLNNFLFVMSRVAMMDSSLVAFLMWSLVAYTAALRVEVSVTKRRILVCSAGLLLGLAGACKWNAVDTLVVLLVASFVLPWIARTAPQSWQGSLARDARTLRQIGNVTLLVGLVVFPALSYSLMFWPLCRSLGLSFGFHQLAEMNRFIWHFHRTVMNNVVMSSRWHTWPLNLSPQRGLSYLVGNPIVSYGGLVALIVCARRLWTSFSLPEGLVVLLYLANMGQWAVTPQHGLFYYYYYPLAMFLSVTIAIAWRDAPARVFGVRTSLVLLLAAAVVFVWCLPNMAHLGPPWDCALGCWS